MSRILVLYASHFGQTHAIAKRLAASLVGRDHHVEVVDAKLGLRHLPAPDAYDVVVLGSRVELGHHADDITAYILAHLEKLERKPTAFFSVSMAASKPSAGPDPNGYMETLFEHTKWKPRCFTAFAGGLPYRRYGRIMRFIMKRVSHSAGHTTDTSRDHEFTDWHRVDAFAETIAALAPGEAPVVHGT